MPNQHPKFSIIIPAYNTEAYVETCLNSVLQQTYTDWECLVVNDGSTDGTASLLNAYAEKDKRIKVFHQSNRGPAVAREKAIDAATGDYLVFADSDDRIVLNALERLEQTIAEHPTDIIFFNSLGEWEGKIHNIALPFEQEPLALLKKLFLGELPGWLHSKIVKRAYWKKHQIKIIPQCFVMEDVLITMQLLIHHPSMQKIPDHLYVYNRMNDDSLTGKKNSHRILEASAANILLIESLLKDADVLAVVKQEYGQFVMNLKLYYLHTRHLNEGLEIMPHYHRHIKYYPRTEKKRYLYYLIFNLGFITKYLF